MTIWKNLHKTSTAENGEDERIITLNGVEIWKRPLKVEGSLTITYKHKGEVLYQGIHLVEYKYNHKDFESGWKHRLPVERKLTSEEEQIKDMLLSLYDMRLRKVFNECLREEGIL